MYIGVWDNHTKMGFAGVSFAVREAYIRIYKIVYQLALSKK
jgi:hypothetical protein